ncbi:MAG: metallophosphoesterase [Polyangiaceae bacterium]
MAPPDLGSVLWATLAAYAGVVLIGGLLRSRVYAIFRLITLGLYGLIFWGLARAWLATPLWPVFLYLHASVYLHSLMLVRPRLFPWLYRALVSIPNSYFAATMLLSWPWAVVSALGFAPWGFWLPAVVALFGVGQSLFTRPSEVHLVLDGDDRGQLARCEFGEGRAARPLSLMQITDPHLGPFMSVARLRAICEHIVERKPDLVLLTGDYLTMESQRDPSHLRESLLPLRALPGRCFACFGNHDHEAPETVKRALADAGVQLLVDDATIVQTDAGVVQILGMDYHYRDRAQKMRAVLERHPRVSGAMRLVLLHHPGAFRELVEGEADLVLSGHTHGGQVGLLSLGLHVTMLRLLMNSPDHGFWSQGRNRLYVHRGTGHYGFPLRVGVPAEQSLVHVHRGDIGAA